MEFKVSTSTEPARLSRAIASTLQKEGRLDLVCLGAGAINQAVKSWIIARSILLPIGIEIKASPYFKVGDIKGEEKTFVVITLERA